jgi:cytidylate kinase
MRVLGAYEKARIYIEKHTELSEKEKIKIRKLNPGPTITISREAGIGAEKICEKLISYFKNYSKNESSDWTFFDKSLINKVLDDHHLPKRLSKFMNEEKTSVMNSMMNELLALQPSKLKLINKTSKTVYQIAELGNVIIVGRAGNFIAAKLKNTFHLRLVAPLNERIKNAQKLYNLSKTESQKFLNKEDKSRKEFIFKHYHKNIDDPLLYHLTLNTSLLSFEEIAETIGGIVVKRFPEMFDV